IVVAGYVHYPSCPYLPPDFDFDADHQDSRGPPPQAIHDNGMLHLVLHYLSQKLIREMEGEEETMLNQRQGQVLHDKITGFYDEILKHPALNSNRIAFSQKKPDFAEYRPDHPGEASPSHRRGKRATGLLTEICQSVRGWEQETIGVTRNHEVVNLYPDQHFFTTRCLSNGQSCNYINDWTVTSECTSRSSWTIAYVEVLDGSSIGYDWEWIAIDTCCSCAASA
ncbi:neurotrophin-3-like, partial [Patiria miniata]|uniref:Nerve growth factor-related domain-containing protein n=1 Tax=Patiria miniata TaxID=46514 RepID=A0A914B6Q9_PATMI